MENQQSSENKPKRKISKKNIFVIVAVIVVVCILCSVLIYIIPTSDEPTSTDVQPTSEIILPTDTLVIPTDTQVPTSSPEPTITPEPTNTPAPTNTPEPTNTPTPPPEPLIYQGTGDSIVDIEMELIGGIGVAHIVGNNASRHFAVKSYDANNNPIDLLVNTTDPYDGMVPINFMVDEKAARFEISASGEWIITLYPIAEEFVYFLNVPGQVTGSGDYVFFLTGGAPDTALIIGNAQSRNFAVKSYGDRSDLLVNTTDPYEGTVLIDPSSLAIEITANGEWSVDIASK